MPRTQKRFDTLDPLSGVARVNGVRAQLNTFTSLEIHFKTEGAETYESVVAEDVETEDGAGTPGPLNAADGLPENRGKWRAPITAADVGTAGTYTLELEAVTSGGAKVHFPSALAENETLQIDEDVSND